MEAATKENKNNLITLFVKNKMMWSTEFLPYLDVKDLSRLRSCNRILRDFIDGKHLILYMQETKYDL
jgi:hypothetical protein